MNWQKCTKCDQKQMDKRNKPDDTYRITSVLKVEKDITTSITSRLTVCQDLQNRFYQISLLKLTILLNGIKGKIDTLSINGINSPTCIFSELVSFKFKKNLYQVNKGGEI